MVLSGETWPVEGQTARAGQCGGSSGGFRDSATKCQGPRAAAAREDCEGDPTEKGASKAGDSEKIPTQLPFGVGDINSPRKTKKGASLLLQVLLY